MIVLDGAGLSSDDVVAVAREGEAVQLDGAARARNAAARDSIAALLQRGEPLYGASTGVGALRDRVIAAEDREQLQWNLLRSHAVTAGPPLPREAVRAAMVVRANQLGAGGAGVAVGLHDALITALNDGVTPFTRELSGLGTGDLGTLSEIALALLGEGRVWHGEKLVGAQPLAGAVKLGLRDALGFISSNATTIGQSALLSADAQALHDAWLTVAAVSFEAIGADPVVLDERAQAGRGSPHQAAVAARMRELLCGYSREQPDRGSASSRLVQDPYPFRVLPQVDAVSRMALSGLEAVLGRELNARTENALIEDGRAWPNGNFHAAELGAALDALRAALGQSASLIAARVSVLLEQRITGLPQFLANQPGLESGVMIVEYVAQAAAAEARSLATPMAIQSISASMGVESHASLATTSAKLAAQQLDAIRILTACELVVAIRAIRMAQREPSGAGSKALFKAAAPGSPATFEDRTLSPEIEAARAVLERWRTPRDHRPGQ